MLHSCLIENQFLIEEVTNCFSVNMELSITDPDNFTEGCFYRFVLLKCLGKNFASSFDLNFTYSRIPKYLQHQILTSIW